METWIDLAHYTLEKLIVDLSDFDIFEDILKFNTSFLYAIFESIEKTMTFNMNIL